MELIFFVNSALNKKGNIGTRASKIISVLEKDKTPYKVFSRDADIIEDKIVTMGLLKFISRSLNAFRIFLNKRFCHRFYDIKIFEIWAIYQYKKYRRRTNIHTSTKIAHVWEMCPRLISILKSDGYKVILDFPIAPLNYARDLIEKFPFDEMFFCKKNFLLETKSIHLADLVICPSTFVKKCISDLGIASEKLSVVSFGADSNSSKINRTKTKRPFTYCFAGNVSDRKGINYLLEIWNDPLFKDDRLFLLGRVSPKYVKLIKNNINFKNIITPGFVDIENYFMESDVYVFPSFMEGSSKSIYEAMSYELACIVTKQSGSVIKHLYDGILIEAGDRKSLKKFMISLKSNHALRKSLAKNAKDKINKFSWLFYSKNTIRKYSKF